MQSVVKEQELAASATVSEITIEDIRKKKLFSSLTNEMAQNLLEFIKGYCDIIYRTFGNEKSGGAVALNIGHTKSQAA